MGACADFDPTLDAAARLLAGLNGRRCAVTGASGFLGRALLERLRGVGCDVRALVRGTGTPLRGSVETVHGDVRDTHALRRLVEGCDRVFHLAAWVHRSTSRPDDEQDCWSVNHEGTRRLVEAMRRVAPEAFLVHVSTSAVYGPTLDPAEESAPCRPRTPYAHAKLAAEGVVMSARARGELRAVVVRPSGFFGRGAPGNLRPLSQLGRLGLRVLVDGGTAQRSLAHVTTVTDALALLAAAGPGGHHVYNVSDDRPVSVAELTLALCRASGRQPLTLDLPLAAALRLGAWADRVTSRPRLRPLIETYAQSSVVSTQRLRAALPFRVRLPTLAAIAGGEA